MNKILLGFLFVTLFASCGGKRVTAVPFDLMTQMVDSVTRKRVKQDTSLLGMQEKPRPIEADELFDDFIFIFASDKVLQKQRIQFPLLYRHEGVVDTITKNVWEHINLFPNQNYYTILFDREEDMDLVGDTSLHSVQVEWLLLKKRILKKYLFQKMEGMWMLNSIDFSLMKVEKEHDDFFSFYTRFVTDSVYQRQHICSPLKFVTIDPDDDFAVLETTLDIDQWYAFRPVMPTDSLSNFYYGQKNEALSNTKILKVNGIGNGYSNIFYFRKRRDGWELYKYEDTSI